MATRAAGKQRSGRKPQRQSRPFERRAPPADALADRPPAQRGPRPPADRRVRGAGGIPGAGRVAQARPAGRQPGPAVGDRHGDGDRVRRRARDRRHAARQQARRRPRPGAQRPAGDRGADAGRRRGADRRHQDLRLLRAHARSGTRHPSASACTRSRPSARPTGSAPRDRVPRPRRAAGHLAPARHRQARARAGLPGLPGPGPHDGPHARAAHPRRAPRARHRPRARRRRDGPSLGPAAAARRRDRAPPRRRRDRRGRARAARRHARPLRAGPGDRARPAAGGRAPGRPRPAGPARGAVRASRPAARPPPRHDAVPAVRRASWRC